MASRLALAFLAVCFLVAPSSAQGRAPVPDVARARAEGLRWLARHQQADGSWSAHKLSMRCDPGASCDGDGEYLAFYDPGLTALAVLAFADSGYGPRDERVLVETAQGERARAGEIVTSGLEALARFQREDGAVTPDRGFTYNEALALLAFSAAIEHTRDPRWLACAQRSVDWLERAQRIHPSRPGRWGWRYASLEDAQDRAGDDPRMRELERHDADTSVTAWVVRALARARSAGCTVNAEALQGALEFTLWATASDGGVGYVDPKGAGATVTGKNDHFEYHPAVMSALGMSTRMDFGSAASHPFFESAVARLMEDLPRVSSDWLSIDYYYWHSAARALRDWKRESPGSSRFPSGDAAFLVAAHEALVALQEMSADGCERGGWLRFDRWSYTGGPVYTTAINVLTLGYEPDRSSLLGPRDAKGSPTASKPREAPKPASVEPAETVPEFPAGENRVATGLSNAEEEQLRSMLRESLTWLLRHQNADGSWSAASLKDHCDVSSPCFDPKEQYRGFFDEGATALALLGFLGAGFTHESKEVFDDAVRGREHVVGEAVKNGLQWLVKRQNADGFYSRDKAFLYNEALATLALVEAHGLTRNTYWKEPAQKGVEFLQRAQRPSPSGKGLWGWRYASREEVEANRRGVGQDALARELHDADTSITSWCARALSRARSVGLTVRGESLDGALAFLRWVSRPDGRVGYVDPKGAGAVVTGKNDHFQYHSAAISALALDARLALDDTSLLSFVDRAADRIAVDPPRIGAEQLHVDYYYWLAGTRALLRAEGGQGARWTAWKADALAALSQLQASGKQGCARGGFTLGDRWAYAAGPLYTTATNALTLEGLLGFAPREPWWRRSGPRAVVGSEAPLFSFVDRAGSERNSSSLAGSVIVLHFFSPWSPGLAEEIAAAEALAERWKGAPFALVGVGFAPRGGAGEYATRALALERPWFAHVLDDLEHPIFAGFDVRSFPTRIVIDAKGILRGRELSWEGVEQLLESSVDAGRQPK